MISELDQEPEVPNGQQVAVDLRMIAEPEQPSPGEGLRRAFGARVEDADELDRYMEWNRQQLKIGRPEIES